MTKRGPGRRRLTLLAAWCLALPLLGCGVQLPGAGDPPQLFVLTPKSTFAPDLPRADWQLVIETPVAASGLDTTRIALQRSPVRLDYFARAAWTDRAPQMIQTLLIESFENSNKIVAVGRESIGLRADYTLKTELREFQAEYDGDKPPRVHVRINAKLVRMSDRAIIASETADYLVPAENGAIESVVLAFDEALGKSLRRVVEWTLRLPGTAPRRSSMSEPADGPPQERGATASRRSRSPPR